jgi:hypothetical protein
MQVISPGAELADHEPDPGDREVMNPLPSLPVSRLIIRPEQGIHALCGLWGYADGPLVRCRVDGGAGVAGRGASSEREEVIRPELGDTSRMLCEGRACVRDGVGGSSDSPCVSFRSERCASSWRVLRWGWERA